MTTIQLLMKALEQSKSRLESADNERAVAIWTAQVALDTANLVLALANLENYQ